MFFVIIFIVFLVFDPLIILILKIIDGLIIKISQFKFSNKYSVIDINTKNTSNRLLIFEEIDSIDLDNCENINKSSLYHNYSKIFFEYFAYINLRKIKKICFIGISLFMNFIILMVLRKIVLKYCYYAWIIYICYVMDICNEKLAGYSEDLIWSNILEQI